MEINAIDIHNHASKSKNERESENSIRYDTYHAGGSVCGDAEFLIGVVVSRQQI